jgi:hypothetical protein
VVELLVLVVRVPLRRVCCVPGVMGWLPGVVAGLRVPGVSVPLVVPAGLVLRLPEVVPLMVPGTAPGVTIVPGLLFRLPGVVTPGVPIAPDVPGVTVVPGVATPGVVWAKAVVLRPIVSRAAPKICIVFIVVVYVS